jgi:hypothetical protein
MRGRGEEEEVRPRCGGASASTDDCDANQEANGPGRLFFPVAFKSRLGCFSMVWWSDEVGATPWSGEDAATR